MREELLPDPDAAARRGAELVAEAARASIADRGSFSLAVSGGHAPWLMFELLGQYKLDWARIALFQVDERIAPEGHDDRNLTHLTASLPAEATSSIHPMPVDEDDLDAAAARYAAGLPGSLDVVHLGLGPDGHTASLIPGDPVLEVTDRRVALTGEYQGRRRMTLTYPAIEAARDVLWLVTGADKVEALAKLRAGDESIPGGRVHPRDATLVCSAEAVAF